MAKNTPHAGKSVPPASHANRDERYAAGKALRDRVPREQHGEWKAPRNRPDPVDLVIESSKGRIPELIPIRYGRMSVSPFTFYRGAALNMAADLAATPDTGIRVQACGDCHLIELRWIRDAGTARDFRHQRFRRDAAGPVGVGCQAARCQLRARCAVERFRRRRTARCRAGLRAFVSQVDREVCRHACTGRLVRGRRHGRRSGSRFRRRKRGAAAQTPRQGRGEQRPRKRLSQARGRQRQPVRHQGQPAARLSPSDASTCRRTAKISSTRSPPTGRRFPTIAGCCSIVTGSWTSP